MRSFLISLLLIYGKINAQQCVWTDAALSQKWNKTQKSDLELGYRSTLLDGFDRAYLDMSHQTKISKWMNISGVCRLGLNDQSKQLSFDRQLMTLRTQIGFEISILPLLKIRSKKLDISWQSRQQFLWEQNKPMESMWRNKFSIGYNIRRNPFTPQFSAEYFYLWNAGLVYTPSEVLSYSAGVQWRFFAGGQIALNDQQDIKLLVGYRIKSDQEQILYRISYSYKLD